MARVIGIDLGTTNSCVAVVEGTGPRVLPCRTGQPTTPSVVATTDRGKRLVGHLAKRQAITNAGNTVSGAKRLIGRRWGAADVQRAIKLASYDCRRGPHDDVRVVMGGKEYAIAEISSMVLQELRSVAERALGESVSQAVVTVPAYFNDNQRQATKDAGRIAGLDVLRIINEPTAAALAYGFGKDIDQKVAIFDLGGGTFDISVLEISQGVFQVLATAGDTFLGGEDFDERIIDWLAVDFEREHGIDLRQDRMALQRLRDAAEKAKIELSDAQVTEINLPFICSAPDASAMHLQRQLRRDCLDELVGDLVERTVSICQQTLKEAQVERVDAVILVGGMTRVPLVQQRVHQCFGIHPSKGVHPDEVVACGAAIQGHLLRSGDPETLLLDVTPHDLGIMVLGGHFDVIIDKDSTVPTRARKTFTTTHDGQTQVRIVVLQGNSTNAIDNELLGEFLLDGLRQAPRGEVKVEVTFEISADGILGVSARDLETERRQAIRVTASSGLTEDEIASMVLENEKAMLAAVASEAVEADRQEIERSLREIDRLMGEAALRVEGTDFGQEALRKAQEAAAQARQAVAQRDREAMAASKVSLARTVSFLTNVLEKSAGS